MDSGVRLSQLATMRRFSSSDPDADHIKAFPRWADRANVTAQVAYRSVADKLGYSQTTVSLWRQRFLDQRLEGLYGQHRSSRTTAQGRRLEARIVALTQKQPPDGSTHWTTRKLAQALGARERLAANG